MEQVEQEPDDRENVARRPPCRPTDHRWRPVRGSTREQCVSCGASFPCRVTCLHIDCIETRGDELPEWITAVDCKSTGTVAT